MDLKIARLMLILLKKDCGRFARINRSSVQCQNIHTHKKRIVDSSFAYSNVLKFCSKTPKKCWQCDFPYKSELFCFNCKTLQKLPNNLNYFDIIGVEKNYDIDIDEIQKKYRELQTFLHPDKFGNRSENERQLSEELSSLVNKAYSTLLHPLDRGIYMLQLNGISIPEGSTSAEPDFLMEIMEKNEAIEEAKDDQKEIMNLIKENRELLASLAKNICKAFQDEDNETAKKLIIKMKYYRSIENRLKKLKEDLGIVE